MSDEFLTIGSAEDIFTRKRLLALYFSAFPNLSESISEQLISCLSLSDKLREIDNLGNIPKPLTIFKTEDPEVKQREEIESAQRCSNFEDALDRNYPYMVNLSNLLLIDQLSTEEFP